MLCKYGKISKFVYFFIYKILFCQKIVSNFVTEKSGDIQTRFFNYQKEHSNNK